eukprot:Phypoly_transcript_10334.p1 GENE.Phypoly_transcript_10334~~Phypoly_transcript_10334.p1  ORF type:complete len:406 (+),score=96.16 Phypoly_transcript_10334:79-1296(+)
MSTESKIEELEKKVAELSKSKNKAKVAYFKLKKEAETESEEREKLNKQLSDLQSQFATVNEEITKQKEEAAQKDAKLAELVKQLEEKGGTQEQLTVYKSENNKCNQEIDGLKKEIADLENMLTLKSKQEAIHADTIKALKEELQAIHDAEQEQTEKETKKRKWDTSHSKELFIKERLKRMLELRVADLTKKREAATHAYTELEANYKQLQEEKDAVMKINDTNRELEDEVSNLTSLVTEKQNLLEKVQSSVTTIDTLVKTLKSDLDDIKKIASPSGLTTVLSTLNEIKSQLTEYFKIDHALATSTTVETKEDDRQDDANGSVERSTASPTETESHSLDNLQNAQNENAETLKSKVLELLNEVIKLCNLELEQQVIVRTRAKYLDVKFANYEHAMAAVMTQQMKPL